jgi:glutamate-1-semialdehyde 2,1-aminomutase
MRTSSDSSVTARLAERAASVIPGGVNSNFRFASPGFWASASGSRITNVEGREYIDYVLGMGTALLGHSPASVLDRVVSAQQRLQCPAGQQVAEIELAEKIVEMVPSAEMIRIGGAGSEIVQLALRLARAATRRNLVVKFEGHYHGWLDSIFAGTTTLASTNGAPSTPAAKPQTAGQMPGALSDLAVLPWNDLSLLQGFLAEHGHEVAALIMEPVLCNTSVITPLPGYLEGVRQLCDEHGIVLVFDEVITGFRLDPGGAQAKLGVLGDLTILGKALGGGFPVAALAGRRSIMQKIGDGTVMHGGTYNANAMCLAAAQATLETLSDPALALYSGLYARADQLVAGLAEASARHGGALSVQGIGPVINATFSPPAPITDYRSYNSSDLATQRTFIGLMLEEGIRVTARGTWFISAAHTEDDIGATLDAVERALQQIDDLKAA